MSKKAGIAGFAVTAMILAAANCARVNDIVLNTTPSLPLGIWKGQPYRGDIKRGEVVTFCPPAEGAYALGHLRGYIAGGTCPSGLEMMMKPVAAVAGDEVVVTPNQITVNGFTLKNSGSIYRDNLGRPLYPIPAGSYRVQPGLVWLISSYNPRSYDSRYFGPVPIVYIRSITRPIIVMTTRNPQ